MNQRRSIGGGHRRGKTRKLDTIKNECLKLNKWIELLMSKFSIELRKK